MNNNNIDAIIGREYELAKLAEYAHSGRPEFVAVYGRRRVGKTFLIRKAFDDKFLFYTMGIIEGTFEQQIEAFNLSLEQYGWQGEKANNWMEAFDMLAKLLKQKCARRSATQVVFIDELPCFDTQNSGFIPAFDFFWNASASWINNILLVVCGSATGWMLKNLIYSRGGLHKRLTGDIALHPFDLYTVEQYCRSRKGKWDRMSILQAYSVFGGIPYYLSLLNFSDSVAQNIDRLFFGDKSPMKKEYKALYRSVYNNPDGYMAVVEMLAGKKQGMTRAELAKALGVHDNGGFGDMLNSPKQNNFYGLAFERVCMFHYRQVIRALGVGSIHTEFYSWRSRTTDPGVQIDMVIDRSDGVVNLCEMKYSRLPYVMTKTERKNIEWREAAFQAENRKKQWTQVVMVTTNGLARNIYSDVAIKEVTLDDLLTSGIFPKQPFRITTTTDYQ